MPIVLHVAIPQRESLRHRQRRVHVPRIRTEDVPADLESPPPEVIAEEVVHRVVLLQYEIFVNVEERHVSVVIFELRGAHVIRVHLTMRARFWNDPYGVPRIPTTILPILELVIPRVVDQVYRVKS